MALGRWNPFNKKIGLALGGGAARGLAHIGVLEAFEQQDIPIDYIAGTSVGAIIAAFAAFGKKHDSLEEIAHILNAKSVASFTLQRKGFLNTKNIEQLIKDELGENLKIEDAEIPLAIIATDIESGESIVFQSGDLIEAICASVSVPGLFVPIESEGRQLVDGGITNNVPVDVVYKMGAGITVGVDLSAVKKYPEAKDVLAVMNNAIDIAIDSRTRERLRHADLVISLDLYEFDRLDNSQKIGELIEKGRDQALIKLARLTLYRRFQWLRTLQNVARSANFIKTPEVVKRLFSFFKK